jgi:hypothetical protein
MTKAIVLSLVPCVSLLAACSPLPQTTDFNGESVKIRTTSVGPRAAAWRAAQPEADRVCGERGRVAQYASTTKVPDTNKEEHFFICVDKAA